MTINVCLAMLLHKGVRSPTWGTRNSNGIRHLSKIVIAVAALTCTRHNGGERGPVTVDVVLVVHTQARIIGVELVVPRQRISE
jgi:hypothetical protein